MKTTVKAKTNGFIAVLALMLIASCTAPAATGVNDPYERTNRGIHGFNRGVDRALLRPASKVYGFTLPNPVRQGIGNFASNLNLPGIIVNNLLQLDIDGALFNSTRFLINTTVGLGGLLDPATAIDLHEREADFGQTLHVWGVGEGPYVELPFVGPSTTRDTVGMVVDVFSNPLTFGQPSPERYMSPVVKGLSKLGDRYDFSDTVDSILYDSADSYAQARLLYLQHRRFKLGEKQTSEGDDYDDPYAE